MKKLLTFAVILMLILVMASISPLAQSEERIDEPSFTVSELTLGDTRQVRSNPRHDDDDDQEVNVTGTITVTNNGNKRLTGLETTVSLGRHAGDQRISLSDLTPNVIIAEEGIILDVGESTEVEVEMRVPKTLDAVDTDGRKSAFNVADIEFRANYNGGTIAKTAKVKMEAENNLRILDARIIIGDSSEEIDEDDNVDDIRPGDTIKLTFEVENDFKNDDEVDIEDIELIIQAGGDLDLEKRY